MFNDFTNFLWLLKIGAFINLYFLTNTYIFPSITTDLYIIVPARILFGVSAYRCLFPVQYKNNVVFHNSPFSSVFLTRLFATFSEISYIYLLSHVIRLLNINHVEWVNFLSWLMVLQVAISQCFVWGAILTRQLIFYYYEELGWAIIFSITTIVSAYLYLTIGTLAGTEILIRLNLLFGIVYLPWQFISPPLELALRHHISAVAVYSSKSSACGCHAKSWDGWKGDWGKLETVGERSGTIYSSKEPDERR